MPSLKLSGAKPGPDADSLLDEALNGLADDETLTPGKPATPAGEIYDPITGELLARDDIDALIDSLARVNKRMDELSMLKNQIREAAGELVASGTGKTRRIQGHRRKAVVEMPDQSWDQSKLKEAWNSYPDLRDQVLKIGTIDVKLVEFKKLASTAAATPNVQTFKAMVEGAKKPATALPAVKIEE